jgi:hypothetical protein
MYQLLVYVILALHPELQGKMEYVNRVAEIIEGESLSAQIDPLLIVSVIEVESQFKSRQVSETKDYGLMQIHVSKTSFPEYRGHEHLLLDDIALNIHHGVNLLRYWRKHHAHNCKGQHHRWWSHYNHGAKIFTQGWAANYSRRLGKIYAKTKWEVRENLPEIVEKECRPSRIAQGDQFPN